MPETAVILTRNRRQAMDWSLVLASQGIEPTIQKSEQGFELVVPGEQFEIARLAIEKYRAENRGWHWQRMVFDDGVVFHWASLCWVLLIVVFHWVGSRADLATRGIMDSEAVAHGQWWRLFTAVWLHGDIGHLATNAAIGVLLLGFAMGRFGVGTALAAACLSGVGGNLFAWAASPQVHRSLGASGAVMGCLGLLAVQSALMIRLGSRHPRRWIVGGLASGILLFVLLGLSPESDVLAHLGGFVSGIFLGAGLVAIGDRLKGASANLLGGLLFGVLVVVPWYFAWRE
jgi:membrane associated rhomboid family serine protease